MCLCTIGERIGRNDVCPIFSYLKRRRVVILLTFFAPLWMGNFIGISMGKGEMDWRRDWRVISDVQRAIRLKPDVSQRRSTTSRLRQLS